MFRDLGIVLHHGIKSGRELKRYASLAENSGFSSIWLTERYFHEETFSVLGYISAVTNSIKLGVGVVNPFTRNLALLGMATSTLDRISDGRFILGLGRSERSIIEDKMGISYDSPLTTMENSVRILRELLSSNGLAKDNNLLNLKDIKLSIKPVQNEIPIYLAAIGPSALRTAGSIADGVILNAYVPAGYVKYAVKVIKDSAAKAGKDPSKIRIACMLVIRPTENPKEMYAKLKGRVVKLLQEPYIGEILLDKGGFDPCILNPLRNSFKLGAFEEAQRLVSNEIVDSLYLVGSMSYCREKIEEYVEAGVDQPLLLPYLDDFSLVAKLINRY